MASAASSLPCALMQAHGKHLLLPCAIVFAVCRAVRRTAKFTFAVFLYFAVCLPCSTRQRGHLPCARFWAHGKVAAHGSYAVSGSACCMLLLLLLCVLAILYTIPNPRLPQSDSLIILDGLWLVSFRFPGYRHISTKECNPIICKMRSESYIVSESSPNWFHVRYHKCVLFFMHQQLIFHENSGILTGWPVSNPLWRRKAATSYL